MSETLDWLPPRAIARRPVGAWLVVAVATYLASVALVVLFHQVSDAAETARLIQVGALHPVAMEALTRTGYGFVLSWLTDWRAVLIWLLAASSSVAAVAVAGKGDATGSGGLQLNG